MGAVSTHRLEVLSVSESLFRTLKYRPEFPSKPFASLEDARAWIRAFVAWYNDEHLHSGIRFVTPISRHEGEDILLLERLGSDAVLPSCRSRLM